MMIKDENLREVIRLVPAARALKDQLEKSLYMETFSGTGDVAVKSYNGLHQSISRFTDDPYVHSLTPDIAADADDKQKVSLILLVAGQLLAYVEGQIGLSSAGGDRHQMRVVAARGVPLDRTMHVGHIVDAEGGKVVDVIKRVMKDDCLDIDLDDVL